MADGSILDGLIIRDGLVPKGDTPAEGGGLWLSDSTINIVNCAFIDNGADDAGGAIYATNSAIQLNDSQFMSNGAYYGGAIHAIASTVTAVGCLFDDNIVGGGFLGGAIYADSTTLALDACVFTNNRTSSAADAGAIYAKDGTMTGIDCSFVGNESGAGGAIRIEGAATYLENCEFLSNLAIFQGAAIHATGGIHLNSCMFENNIGDGAALVGSGNWLIEDCEFIDNPGGINVNGHLILVGSTFINNGTASDGGGVRASGTVEIDDCLFQGNSSTHTAGAISMSTANAVLRNTRIVNNLANGNFGGGIVADGSLTLINCEVVNNIAPQFNPPGGIYMDGDLTLINTLVAQNYPGGIMLAEDSSAQIINSTIGRNQLGFLDLHAGLMVHESSFANVRNSIIWGHGQAGTSCEGSCGGSAPGCWCDADCCLFGDCCADKFEVCGGCEPDPMASDEILLQQIRGPADVENSFIHGYTRGSIYDVPGANNSGDDPLFFEPQPKDDDDTGNFRLQAGSPAIDAGDNAFVPADVEFDLDGNPRIIDGDDDGKAIVDIGAYEFTGDTPLPADGDLNGDGVVNEQDLILLLTAWGPCAALCAADLDGSSAVGVPDLLILLASWG